MTNHPKGMVVMSLVACTVLIGGNSLLSMKFPSYKQIGGVYGAFLLLSIGVEFAPDIAAMFALIVLVTVFLNTFGSLSKEFQNLLAGKHPATKIIIGGAPYTGPSPATMKGPA